MIDVKEHIYEDDPKIGHTDVRTVLKDVSYFFLGNGLIQAVVQFSPQGEGTPLGLMIMNPDLFCKKRDTLTFHADTGLENTQIKLEAENDGKPAESSPKNLRVSWVRGAEIPQVLVKWEKDVLEISELFHCPSSHLPVLIREVTIKNLADQHKKFTLKTSTLQKNFSKQIELEEEKEQKIILQYELDQTSNSVSLLESATHPELETATYWKNVGHFNFSNPLYDHIFSVANSQLPAVFSNHGKTDACFWQYNREWLRDQAFIIYGLTAAGHHKLAGKLLNRIIRELVSEDGDCVDAGERRDPEEVELDQNGLVLYVLEHYVLWTNDFNIVVENWDKIVKIAEFPLKEIFRHEASGLFCNCRDYWERHRAHGIKDGLELMYQIYPSVGLKSAANLARKMGKNTLAHRWENYAAKLREAVLDHPDYTMVNEKGFIKRLNPDGTIQESIIPTENSGLPDGVPLADKTRTHRLDPDACTVMPIVLEYVPADSEITAATLKHVEKLWNQEWKIGGHARVNTDSEADSAGPWPVASIIIAKANIESKDYGAASQAIEWLNTLPGALSGSWFEMYGPRIAPPYGQNGILPWAWGEILALFIHHIIGIQPKENYIRFRPRVIPGMGDIKTKIPFRNCSISIEIRQVSGTTAIQFECDEEFFQPSDEEILISFTGADISITAVVP